MALTRPRAYQIYDIDYKQATRVVTVSDITLGGGAPNAVDGVNLSLNDRILVAGQTTTSQNGIYYVTTVGSGSNGTWARSVDTNNTGEILTGTIVMVTEGNIFADTQWKLITDGEITVGTTPQVWVQNYLANSISSGTSNIVVNANANVTISSAGTANVLTVSSTGTVVSGTVSATGNITGGNANIIGTTASTSRTTGALKVAGGVGVAGDLYAGNSIVVDGGAYGNVVTTQFAGVFATASGPNPYSIMQVRSNDGTTGMGIQAYTGINGKIYSDSGITFTTGATIKDKDYPTGGTTRATLDSTGLAVTGIASASGNITGGNILTSGLISGNVLSATGNAYVGNILTDNYYYANGVAFGGGGGTPGGANTQIQFNDNGAFAATAGLTFDKTSNAVVATGNITGSYFIGNGSQLTGLPAGYANSNVVSYGETGWAGNIVPSANVTYNLGNVTNQWKSIYVGANTLYINNVAVSVNSSNVLTVAGANVTTQNANGNITAGNVSATNLTGSLTTAAQANITSVGTLTSLNSGTISSSGNVTGANIVTGGLISATGNITGGNLNLGSGTITSGPQNVTGNINVSGNVNVTGNLNYQNVTDLVVGDPLIYLGANAVGDVDDLGFVVNWDLAPTGYQHGGFARDATDGVWKLFGNVVAEPTTTIDFTNAIYQPFKSGAITATSGAYSLTLSATGNITGGNIVTAGSISATGAITSAGNLSLTGNIVDIGEMWINTSSNGNINLNPNGTGTTNIPVGVLSVTGNIQGGNLRTAGLISATGNITGGNLSGTSIVGTLTTAAQTNITSVGTLGSLTVTANIQGGNLRTAGLISATGTVTGSSFSGAGTGLTGTAASLTVGAATTATTAATVTTAAQPNITSVGTLTSVSSSGAISAAGTVTGSSFSGAGTGLTGTASSLTVGAATTAGTVTTAAQPNITSTGTLTSITTSGAITASGSANYSFGFAHGNWSRVILPAANNGAATGDAGLYQWISEPGVTWTGAGIARNRNNTTTFARVNNSLTGQMLRFGESTDFYFTSQDTGNVNYAPLTLSGNNATISGALTVNSTAGVTAIINGATTGVGNIGSSTVAFNTIFAKATSAQYADLAEMYCADTYYEPGTVVEFGGTEEITISSESHSTRVAGIISTNPSYLMNSALECEHALEVALVGRVPCRVVGTIYKGDRLVASGIPGVATALDPNKYQPGCIIGKALEAYDSIADGIIEVAVGRT